MEKLIIDLHTHTYFSDGDLGPSELIQRARVKGYGVIGITDHSDFSNYQHNLDCLLSAKKDLGVNKDIKVLVGLELTHIPPLKLESLIFKCRAKGADIIVVHGETIMEPVEKGTNEAAIKSGTDILAHPGLITEDLVKLAADKHVFLEITARRGSSLTNGYVVKMAQKCNAHLVINSDTHSPDDLFSSFDFYQKIGLGAGLSLEEFAKTYQRVKEFTDKL